MIKSMIGGAPRERAAQLLKRLPFAPESLPPQDPARIVAELMEEEPEWSDDMEWCESCDGLRSEMQDLEDEVDVLEDFVDDVSKALGLRNGDFPELLESIQALKAHQEAHP